jgi:hypothetical protein
MGASDLRPADNDDLQRVPISKTVNSSRADTQNDFSTQKNSARYSRNGEL